MIILVWTLGLPTVATLLAIAWVSWSTRPRGPAETHDSVAAHERFKTAMAKKPPAPRQRRPAEGQRRPAEGQRRPAEGQRRPADTPSRRVS